VKTTQPDRAGSPDAGLSSCSPISPPLVLSQPRGGGCHGSPPSDKTLNRVFGPVSPSRSPDEGRPGSLARPAGGWGRL